jgi:hypothetical protein
MSFHLIRKASAVLPLLTLLAAGTSFAQTGGTSGTTSVTATALTASDFTFFLEYYDSGNWVQMNDTQKKYFFNRARCECYKDTTDYTGYFKIVIQPGTNTAAKIQQALTTNGVPFGVGKLYASSNSINCLSPGTYSNGVASACTNLLNPTPTGYDESFPLTVFEAKRLYESPPIPVSVLFGALSNCGPANNCCIPDSNNPSATCSTIDICSGASQAATIYFWAQTTNNTYPDASDITLSLTVNGELQYGPIDVTADGGNEALTVHWNWATGLTPSGDANFLGVQLFCARGADNMVFAKKSYGATYMQSSAVCRDFAAMPASPSAFSNQDPIFLCSGLLPSTTTSHRIPGLQNGIWYTVGVAAIDRFGNTSPITQDDLAYGQPIATVDFYTDYRGSGGQAQGGFCSVSRWPERPSAFLMVSMAALGVVALRRRRHRRKPGKGELLLLVVAGTMAASQARADAIFHDDMDMSDDANKTVYPKEEPPAPPPPSATWTGSERNFAIEIRFGLYYPNVDSEFGPKNVSPNHLIFGNGRRVMWQAEFDWEVLQMFGTLSLGASLGYWKANAQACYRAQLEAKGECDRSGDNTSLRLIPFAALLVYRMDEAAKRWGIPIVPYGKLGLNYTIWTVNNGDGNVPNYPQGGRGQGGTPGWQAAVGLSLQLDFIDPAAAREFDSESGVNHTYAFFEMDHVDGSGLYRSDVLRVGDNTWFAGLMFEF